MKKTHVRRETKIVIDFMNADFTRESGKRDTWAKYLLDDGLSLKEARAIQETVLAAHGRGSVLPVADGVRDYADIVEWTPSKDRQKFGMLRNISGALRTLYVSLVYVINSEQFFSLKRCAECSRFFPDGQKRQYCSDACLRKHNSTEAQKRVEQARVNKRWNEIKSKLIRLQALGRRLPFSEIVQRLPGFDAKLLADIIEEKRERRELANEIKYKNRKILMEAKL